MLPILILRQECVYLLNKSSLFLSPQQRAAFILMQPQIVEGGAAAEAKQALTNMGHILKYKIRFCTKSIYSNNK